MTESSVIISGTLIKAAREKKDMTQFDLGKALGFKQGIFIGAMEKGKSPVPYNRIPEICWLLDLDPIEFFKQVLMERDPEMAKSLCGAQSITIDR